MSDMMPGRFERQNADGWTPEDAAMERRLDERLDAALARLPEVRLPEDFAARVAAELSSMGEAARPPAHYGRTALLACGALLVMVLLVLMAAGHTQGPRWLLSLLSLELAILALGAGPWRRVLRWPA